GAIGFKNIGDDPNRVRKLVRTRSDRFEAALGEGAVADFTPARPPDRTALADAEGWKVIVQHEFLAVLLTQTVDALFIADGPQRGGHQGLRLAASKDSRSVSARQDADFAGDPPQLAERTAVNPFAFKNQVPNHALLESLEGRG